MIFICFISCRYSDSRNSNYILHCWNILVGLASNLTQNEDVSFNLQCALIFCRQNAHLIRSLQIQVKFVSFADDSKEFPTNVHLFSRKSKKNKCKI